MEQKPQKLKRGFRRDDGMILWEKRQNHETWLTEEEFEFRKKIQKQKSREYYLKNRQTIIARVKKYTQENLESKKRYWREYNLENKQRKQEYKKRYRKENLQKILQKNREYREKNREKIKIFFREYRKKNKDLVAGRIKKYLLRFPEIAMEIKARNRAKRRNAAKHLTKNQKKLNEQFFIMSKRLKECLNIDWHVDHIIPIAGGGLHEPSNLMVVPAAINLKKGSRTDLDFSKWRTEENFIFT